MNKLEKLIFSALAGFFAGWGALILGPVNAPPYHLFVLVFFAMAAVVFRTTFDE